MSGGMAETLPSTLLASNSICWGENWRRRQTRMTRGFQWCLLENHIRNPHE